MDKELFKKKVLPSVFVFLVVIATFFALFFNFYSVEGEGYNGFALFSSEDMPLEDGVRYLCLAVAIAIIVCTIFEIIALIVMNIKNSKALLKIERIFIISDCVLTLLYMGCGIYAKSMFGSMAIAMGMKTFAFIPFIIVVFLSVFYFIISKQDKKKNILEISESDDLDEEQEEELASGNIENAANALLKYKEMLQNGEITQEEFEEKRKKLL